MLMKQKRQNFREGGHQTHFLFEAIFLSVQINPYPLVFGQFRDVDVPIFDSTVTTHFHWFDLLRLSLGIHLAERLNQNN